MTPTARDAIAQAARLLAEGKVTEGEWLGGNWTVGGGGYDHGIWEWSGSAPNPDDAAFIAAARTALPALLEALRDIAERGCHDRCGSAGWECSSCVARGALGMDKETP